MTVERIFTRSTSGAGSTEHTSVQVTAGAGIEGDRYFGRHEEPGQNITFDWNDVSGAATYTIQIDDHDSFPSPWLVNQTVTSSTFSISTLPTRTMWWRARANDASGNPGNWSGIRRFEVKD